ncbi:TOMM precursor leader peptide-binding protein [Patescibacteria group bacterium]|nr:TOMM precursor leader peptide-binding protein [Patescibacteria group bacterium]
MEGSFEKIRDDVFIYRINNDFFIRHENNVFEIEEADGEKLVKYIKAFEVGIDPEDFIKKIEDDEVSDFQIFYDFLKNRGLIERVSLDYRSDDLTVVSMKVDSIGVICDDYLECKNAFVDEMIEVFAKNGLSKVVVNDFDCDICVVIKTENMDEQRLKIINGDFFEKRKNWILVDVSIGGVVTIGPLIIPAKTPCYECLFMRKKINKDVITLHDDFANKVFLKKGQLDCRQFHNGFVANMVCDFICRCKEKRMTDMFDNVFYVDLANYEIWREPLLKFPSCKICNSFN